MPTPRKITDQTLDEAVEVALARRALPSDKELARRAGVTLSALQKAMYRRLSKTTQVPRGSLAVMIQQDGSSRPDRISLSSRSDQRAL